MTLLQPTEAPEVHIQPLPAGSKAVMAEVQRLTTQAYNGPSLRITVWTASSTIPCGDSLESFMGRYCEDCSYYTDEMEYRSYGETVVTSDGCLTLKGSFYTESPCPAYDNGLDDISFPCHAGHEPGESDQDLSGDWMRFTVDFQLRPIGLTFWETYAHQQAVLVSDSGEVRVGVEYDAINTFSPNGRICWGNNSEPTNLLETESIYITSKANEDLQTYSTHEEGFDDCQREYSDGVEDPYELTEEYHAIPTPTYNNRGKALVLANPGMMASAYLLLCASGAHINGGVAYVTATFYKDVAVSDDVVMSVWATDVLANGKRILFMNHTSEDHPTDAHNGLMLGQVDADFDLSPVTAPAKAIAVAA